MTMCPLCNAFATLTLNCPHCGAPLDNAGKVSDYADPYAHYEEDAIMKMYDGIHMSVQNQLCPHLMTCQNCGYDEIKLVQEDIF